MENQVQETEPIIDKRTKEYKDWKMSQNSKVEAEVKQEVKQEVKPEVKVEPKPVVKQSVRTQETILKEIEESRKRFAQAQKELSDLQKVEFDGELNDYYDQTTIPQEIEDAYPKAHFHWARAKARDYNRMIRKGYQFVRIPEHCKDLLKSRELSINPFSKVAFGSNILLNDSGENVCMWCPEDRWKRRREQLERKVKSMSNYRANAEISQLQQGNAEMGISGIGNRAGIKEVQMYVHDDKR